MIVFLSVERHLCSIGHRSLIEKSIYFVYLGNIGGIMSTSLSLYLRFTKKWF